MKIKNAYKKMVCAVLAVILILSMTVMPAAADNGEWTQYLYDMILYTDIAAYINHYPISSYACNGKTVVVAEDLRNYGFNVEWDEQSRALYISPNYLVNEISGMGYVDRNSSLKGSVFAYAQPSDISVYYNGVWIKAYSINGYMLISLEDMVNPELGVEFTWDQSTRSAKLWESWTGIAEYNSLDNSKNDGSDNNDTNDENSSNSYGYVQINNLGTFFKEQLSIEKVVGNGIIPTDENGNFDFSKPMTVDEVNQAVSRMAAFVADEVNFEVLKSDIPQIKTKGNGEIATIQDVVDLLTEPGIDLTDTKEWVEMAKPSMLRELAYVMLPENDIETALATIQTDNPALQGYTAAMMFKAIHMWELLKNWESGYIPTFTGKSLGYSSYDSIDASFVAYDGNSYYFINNNSLLCETNGTYRKIASADNILGIYSGYIFYIKKGQVYRVYRDGSYNRKLSNFRTSYGTADITMIMDNDYIYRQIGGTATYRIPISSIDFDSDKIEIEYSDMPSFNSDGGNVFTEKGYRGYGKLKFMAIYKNDVELVSHNISGQGNIDLYNDSVYYITYDSFEDSDFKFSLRKVSRNGSIDFDKEIARFEGNANRSFELGLAGDYAFIRNADVYYRICINENMSNYGVFEKMIFPQSISDISTLPM